MLPNWTNARLRNITGILQMNNIGPGAHAHTGDVRVRDITRQYAIDMFERATAAGLIKKF